MEKRILKLGAAMVVATMSAAPAMAATYTNVLPPDRGHELNHADILSSIYGLDFTSSGNSYVANNGVTATRWQDNGRGATDQYFDPGDYAMSARAVYAAMDFEFGYLDGSSGGSFNPLLSVDENGMMDGPSSSWQHFPDGLRFAARPSSGTVLSSRSADNPGGSDQMVGYLIQGLDADVPWISVFFWEDMAGSNSDWDYNDLVVEVRATVDIPDDMTPPIAAAPSPAAFGAGAMLLTGALLRRRR